MTYEEATTIVNRAKIGTDVSPKTWLEVAGVLLGELDGTANALQAYKHELAATEALVDALQAETARLTEQGVQLVERAKKAEKTCAAIGAWAHEYGAALKPVGADTFGEGVRQSKSQVQALLADDAGVRLRLW